MTRKMRRKNMEQQQSVFGQSPQVEPLSAKKFISEREIEHIITWKIVKIGEVIFDIVGTVALWISTQNSSTKQDITSMVEYHQNFLVRFNHVTAPIIYYRSLQITVGDTSLVEHLLFVTDRRLQIRFLVNTGADMCAIPE